MPRRLESKRCPVAIMVPVAVVSLRAAGVRVRARGAAPQPYLGGPVLRTLPAGLALFPFKIPSGNPALDLLPGATELCARLPAGMRLGRRAPDT